MAVRRDPGAHWRMPAGDMLDEQRRRNVEEVATAACAFGEYVASAVDAAAAAVFTNRPSVPAALANEHADPRGIVVNLRGVHIESVQEVARAIWVAMGRHERAVTFRRVMGFIAEYARLQVAYDAAALSRHGLTRGDWLAMRGTR